MSESGLGRSAAREGRVKLPATTAGLCIALAGPLLPVARLLGDPTAVGNRVLEQLYLWLLAAVLFVVIVKWEKLGPSSVGLSRIGWRSLVWGAVAAALLVLVVSPLGGLLLAWLQPGAYEAGLVKLQSMPIWFLVFAGATAGVVEELLYRGYGIERLSVLTGSIWAGALLALSAFVLVHIPFWGLGVALATLPAGALLTALYVWKRDLVINMVAHAGTAIVQLLVVAGGPGSS